MKYDIIIIGGGASGFFSAISIKERLPHLSVLIIEKNNKLLTKVKISGGGRCNVTHHCTDNIKLIENYPRGNLELKDIFNIFSVQDTVKWFQSKGVKLKTETDGRMFPVSNQSQTIIDCFLFETTKLGIEIKMSEPILNIRLLNDSFVLQSSHNQYVSTAVVVAIGGQTKQEGYSFLSGLGISIKRPIPSLFTFNDKNLFFKHLAGISVQNATIQIHNSDYKFIGPILITHWGFSGPAVLKISAFAAEFLHENMYNFKIVISWNSMYDYSRYSIEIQRHMLNNPKKIYSLNLYLIFLSDYGIFCVHILVLNQLETGLK